MEYIESKDIFYIIKDTLKFIDEKVIEHGYRTAYILYKMLSQKGGYQKYELADYIVLTMLHDIGLYKIDDFDEMIYYETKDTLPHSMYSYLFYKHISPHEEVAEILLYHHTDYIEIPDELPEDIKIICTYLNIAERMDIYREILDDDFDYMMFQKFAGTKLSDAGLALFYDVEEKYQIFRKLKSGEFETEMQEIIDYMIFSNEEMKGYLEMLMYCLGFKSQNTVVDTVTRVSICNVLSDKLFLPAREKELLYYGALLCDVGMLAIPSDIIEAPRKLSPEELKELRTHVEIAEKTFKNRMHQDVVALISAHHERGDGSGYPNKLKESQMTTLQQILQVADVMSALMNDRPYRAKKTKLELVRILDEEKMKGALNRQIVDMVISFYDDIYEETKKEEQKVIATYKQLLSNYDIVERQFENAK